MRQLLIGIMLGFVLAGTPAVAMHYLGHNEAEEQLDRMQQRQERWEQEQFRQEQRSRQFLNPC